jgi:tRNA threonylcarbamoyladenosine biosynthesis protein TsaE
VSSELWTVPLPAEEDTISLAGQFASTLCAPLVFNLRGDLGAGKTTFARALIHALGYEGRVKSPSYGLLESYVVSEFTVLHLDLYRIEHPSELDYLALRDLFDINSILMVEWPEKGVGFLPPPDVEILFDEAENKRFAQICASTDAGQKVLEIVQNNVTKQFLE